MEPEGARTTLPGARGADRGFLGYRFGRNYRPKTGRAYIGTRPSKASVQSICRTVSELTAARTGQWTTR